MLCLIRLENMIKAQPHVYRCLGFCIFVIMSPSLVYADAFQIKPTVILEERFDNNRTMNSETKDPVYESVIKGNIAFSQRSATSNLTGSLHANVNTYYDDGEFSTNNNQFFRLLWTKKSELVNWGLHGKYRRDTTVRSIEIDQASEDDQVVEDFDAGLVQVEFRRNNLKLNPTSGIRINERTGVVFNYNFATVFYDDNVDGSGLFNYYQHRVSGGLLRELSERDSVVANAGAAKFWSEDNVDTTVDSYDLTAGYRRAFSKTSTGAVDVGFRHSSLSSSEQEFSNNGLLVRMSANYRFELSRIQLAAGHELKPSGSGSLIQVTHLNLKAKRKFRERVSGVMLLRAFERKSLKEESEEKKYYLIVEPRVSWRWTRWWAVGAGYKYRKRQEVDSPNDADSHSVFVSLRYSKKMDI